MMGAWRSALIVLLLFHQVEAAAMASTSRTIVTPHRSPFRVKVESEDDQAVTIEVADTEEDLDARDSGFPPECICLASSATGCWAHVGNTRLPIDSCDGGYYGHDASLDPEKVLQEGLPARGSDWDLLHHALQLGGSAFRGTTDLVMYPDGNGAAAWADEGGFVYEVACVPTWDVNKALEGRRKKDALTGVKLYAGNLALGEHENAVPACIPPEHIKRYGRVVESTSGVLFVPRGAWVNNPNFNPRFHQYSHSGSEPAWGC